MKRAYSVQNVLDAKFNVLPFDGQWLDAMGCPQLGGSWLIYGAPKNGKTTLAMQIAKYMCKFAKVAYNSVEEGLSLSIRAAIQRTYMEDVRRRFLLLDKEDVQDITERLSRRLSPDVIIVDSVQFLGLKWSEYKQLKDSFPNKLFIYISHIDGNKPEGSVAQKIWRDSNVYIRVEGFRGFPVSRYGGGKYININEDLAVKYWGLNDGK